MKYITHLTLLLAAVATSSCSDSLEGTPDGNLAPDTELTVEPPSLEPSSFLVRFYWTGFDPDGGVDAYEWRMSSNGPDGILDVEDTLGLPWNLTTTTDSTFLVSADLDSFPADVAEPNQDPRSYRYWQTHTFFVRSIDNQGRRDPTPAHSSFTATTVAPRVIINQPATPQVPNCLSSPRTISFGWTVVDDDDPENPPDAVRYAYVELDELPDEIKADLGIEPSACINNGRFRDGNVFGRLPERFWSPWISTDAPDDSAYQVVFPQSDLGARFLFGVQARDLSGAVTPTFEWGVNVRHTRVSGGSLPLLTVSDRHMGTASFVGKGGLRSFDVITTQPVQFNWEAEADAYGGLIEAYRYGWNLQDPEDEDDPGWAVNWSNTWRDAPPRSFLAGVHNFVAQARDNSGAVTRGTYQLNIIPLLNNSQKRDLLLVDDWGFGNTTFEVQIEKRWHALWTAMLTNTLFTWSPTTDLVHTRKDPTLMNFKYFRQYRSIIWFMNGSSPESFLRESIFSGSPPPFNWMELYQRDVGNVLVTGIQAIAGPFAGGLADYPVIFSQGNTGIWPVESMCLEAVDYIRPGLGFLPCEDGRLIRTDTCDRMTRATVSPLFYERYPNSTGQVTGLNPTDGRINYAPEFKLKFEEFYNINVSCLPVTISLRECQRPMFELLARRDDVDPDTGAPYINFPEIDCQPSGRELSPINKVPVGIVVSTFSDTKPEFGSEDFLWGFHPLAFQFDDIQRSLAWILGERWNLAVRR